MCNISGFTSVVLSTIERRYQFSSTAAGLIASTFDMAVLVSVLFISYFGGKGHKPRWLGISLIIQGTGMSPPNTHAHHVYFNHFITSNVLPSQIELAPFSIKSFDLITLHPPPKVLS